MVAKLALVTALATVGMVACGQQTAQQARGRATEEARARALLFRSMERTPSNNVVAVIMYATASGAFDKQVKLELSREGKSHLMVLQPLSREGIEIIDNGRTSTTLFPDQRMMMVQGSPGLEGCDAAYRLSLVERNYRLRLESTTKVAGREASVVVAIPRNNDLEQRRFYIDSATGFLLRLDAVPPGSSRPITRREVRTVYYPKEIPGASFVPRPLGEVRVVRMQQTRTSVSSGNVTAVAGTGTPGDDELLPVFPKRPLAYGFAIQGIQVMPSSRTPMIAYRVTDGIVKGTVYQFLSGQRAQEAPPGDSSVIDNGRFRFVAIMDAPERVRVGILRDFVKSAVPRGAEAEYIVPAIISITVDSGTQQITPHVEPVNGSQP